MSWSNKLKNIQKKIVTAVAISMYVDIENTSLTDNGNRIITAILIS